MTRIIHMTALSIPSCLRIACHPYQEGNVKDSNGDDKEQGDEAAATAPCASRRTRRGLLIGIKGPRWSRRRQCHYGKENGAQGKSRRKNRNARFGELHTWPPPSKVRGTQPLKLYPSTPRTDVSLSWRF